LIIFFLIFFFLLLLPLPSSSFLIFFKLSHLVEINSHPVVSAPVLEDFQDFQQDESSGFQHEGSARTSIYLNSSMDVPATVVEGTKSVHLLDEKDIREYQKGKLLKYWLPCLSS